MVPRDPENDKVFVLGPYDGELVELDAQSQQVDPENRVVVHSIGQLFPVVGDCGKRGL